MYKYVCVYVYVCVCVCECVCVYSLRSAGCAARCACAKEGSLRGTLCMRLADLVLDSAGDGVRAEHRQHPRPNPTRQVVASDAVVRMDLHLECPVPPVLIQPAPDVEGPRSLALFLEDLQLNDRWREARWRECIAI